MHGVGFVPSSWANGLAHQARAAAAPLFTIKPQQLMRLVASGHDQPVLERVGGWDALARALQVDFARGLDANNSQDEANRHSWFHSNMGDVTFPVEDAKNQKNKKNKKNKNKTDEQLAGRSRCRVAIGVLCHDEPTITLWVLFIVALQQAITDSAIANSSDDGGAGESVVLLVMALAMTGVRLATEFQKHAQLRELYYGNEDTVSSAPSTTTTTTQTVMVLRGGEPTSLPLERLCVGDVLLLGPRDVAVADGLVLPGPSSSPSSSSSSQWVGVDESETLGTSGVAYKSSTSGEVLLAGTRIVDGHVRIVVLGVGQRTLQHQANAIAASTSSSSSVSSAASRSRNAEVAKWVLDNYELQPRGMMKMATAVPSEEEEAPSAMAYVPHATPRHQAELDLMATEDATKKTTQQKNKNKNHKNKNHKHKNKNKKTPKSLQDKATSPFHFQVLSLQRTVRNIGYVAASLLFIVLMAVDLQRLSDDENGKVFVSIVLFAITVIVVTSPEGSELVTTIATSTAIQRLRQHNVMVRGTYAAETPGSMTVLCVDKTGTLTTNATTVAALWTPSEAASSASSAGGGRGGGMTSPGNEMKTSEMAIPDHVARSILLLAVGSNQATTTERELHKYDDLEATATTKTGWSDDPYDVALLELLRNRGVDCERFLLEDVTTSTTRTVRPFTGERKRKSVIITHWNQPPLLVPQAAVAPAKRRIEKVRIVTKGAPETVLPLCTSIMLANGVICGLSADHRDAILRTVVQAHASAGRRVLCIASRELNANDPTHTQTGSRLESELTCVAIVAFEDPVRSSAPHAVELLQQAGVKVCMVTGDHLSTAMAVARQCGIVRPGQQQEEEEEEQGHVAMDAAVFRELVVDHNGKLRQHAFDRVWPSLRVLARAGPLDKYLLVQALQASHQSVGMLGDGINDALALQASDVGFALATSSSSSASRQCAQVVLLDDNLASIASAVAWGRVVRMRMTSYLQLQVLIVCVALGVVTVSALTRHVTPFAAVQLLWINFVTILFAFAGRFLASRSDTVSPTTISTTTSSSTTGQQLQLLDSHARKWIWSQAVYQLAVLSLLVAMGDSLFVGGSDKRERRLGVVSQSALDGIHVETAQITEMSVAATVVFTTFVWMQLVCQAACHARTDCGVAQQSRHFYVAAWLLMAGMQFVVVQTGGNWFNCVPLNAIQWLVCVATAMTTVLVDRVVQWFEAKHVKTVLL